MRCSRSGSVARRPPSAARGRSTMAGCACVSTIARRSWSALLAYLRGRARFSASSAWKTSAICARSRLGKFAVWCACATVARISSREVVALARPSVAPTHHTAAGSLSRSRRATVTIIAEHLARDDSLLAAHGASSTCLRVPGAFDRFSCGARDGRPAKSRCARRARSRARRGALR